MKSYLKKNYQSIISGILAIVFMWLVWFIAYKTIKNEYLVPSFSQTMSALLVLLTESFFWKALFYSLLRTVIAFIISFVLAGLLATLCSVIKNATWFVKTIISIVRTLPTMAILVLIIYILNYLKLSRAIAPVIVAILVLFPMMFAQFQTAINGVDEGLIKAMKVFRLSPKQKVIKVYLPMVCPPIALHIGSNLSFGIKLIISAEVMSNIFTSLGGLMQTASIYEQIPRLIALTLVAVILGLLIELLAHLATVKAFKWAKSEVDND